MTTLPDGRTAGWIHESGAPAPDEIHVVDDNLSARDARDRIAEGQTLCWVGDWHQGRQFLKALKRRLTPRNPPRGSLADRWRAERQQRSAVAVALSAVVVVVEPEGTVAHRRAPDTREAVEWAWGPSDTPRLVPLTTLIGALGAAGWTRAGMEVPGLEGRLTPRYGVFSPTRHAYVALMEHLEVDGRSVMDVGCGTGVLSFVLLQRGARLAVGTDTEPRAIAAAQHNASNLGLAERFSAVSADLWAEDPADLVVFNAPWLPEQPRTRLDRAVFDEEGRTLCRWLTELSDHLTPRGQGALIVSDLPERLGLRSATWLADRIAEAGLTVVARHEQAAQHRRARTHDDPLHEARSAERLHLWLLAAT